MFRFAIVLVMAMLVSLVSWGILNQTYAHRSFASKEAQETLTVSEELSNELLASRLKSDLIAYGLFSALLASVCGAVCVPRKFVASIGVAALLGLLLGAVGGAAGAWLGHLHDAKMVFSGDPMIYWITRWLAVLLPIGLTAGVAASLNSQAKLVDAVVAGAIGAAVAALMICFVSGSLTPIELHSEIFPAHSSNRILTFSLAAVCIAGTIAFQLQRQAKQGVSPLPAEKA